VVAFDCNCAGAVLKWCCGGSICTAQQIIDRVHPDYYNPSINIGAYGCIDEIDYITRCHPSDSARSTWGCP
jgi:hypothetical protein